MSKMDQIRAMREANFERKNRTKAADQGGSASAQDTAGRADAPQRLALEAGSNPAGQGAGEVDKPRFDRTAYQRKYMRDWRRKRTEELKRLRELVGDK